MKTFRKGETYTDKDGNELTIKKVVHYCVNSYAVYYSSETKSYGLIDKDGLYFMSTSIYAESLTIKIK